MSETNTTVNNIFKAIQQTPNLEDIEHVEIIKATVLCAGLMMKVAEVE